MILNIRSKLGNSGELNRRGRRRIINREQGRALEMIGHAVDYLTDCYLWAEPDNHIIDFRCPAMEAVHILTRMKLQILNSLPLV